MKKRILSMLLVIVLVLSLVPVSALADGELTITSSKGSAVIDVDTLTLTATGAAETDTIVWSYTSENGAEVTFDPAQGETVSMKGKTQGKVTVTATTEDGSKTGSKELSIYLKPEELEIIDADHPENLVTDLKIGDTLNLGYIGSNLDQILTKSVRWESGNSAAVKVDETTGKLEAVGIGEANITLKFNGGRAYQLFKVTDLAGTISGKTELTSGRGQTLTLSFDGQTTPDSITWTTEDADPGVSVNLTPNGTSCGVAAGTTAGNITIVAKWGDESNQKATFPMTITAVEPLSITGEGVADNKLTLKGMQTVELTAVVPGGENAADIEWTVTFADNTITETHSGKTMTVTGNKIGTATVTAKIKGDATTQAANLEITVEGKAEIANPIETLYMGDTHTCVLATELLNGADFTWNSSDTTVATVENGIITPVAPGTTTISASLGEIVCSFEMEVLGQARIEIDPEMPREMLTGDKLDLKAVVKDASGAVVEGKTVSWKYRDSIDANMTILGSDKLTANPNPTIPFVVELRAYLNDEVLGNLEADVDISVTPRTASVALMKDTENISNKTTILSVKDTAGITIQAVIMPENARQVVSWEVTPKDVCEFTPHDDSIEIKPVSAQKTGTVTVIATAADGTGVRCETKVELVKTADTIQITNAPAQMRGGANLQLRTNLDEDNTLTDRRVVWSVPKEFEQLASVTADGFLDTAAVTKQTPIKVEVTLVANGAKGEANIMLCPAVTNIKIVRQGGMKLENELAYTSKPIELDREVTPASGYCGSFVWTSSNEKVATVDPASGEMTLKDAGNVRISCTAYDTDYETALKIARGEIRDDSKVMAIGYKSLEIVKKATDVVIDDKGVTELVSGKNAVFTATVYADLATGLKAGNQKVTWSVVDENYEPTKVATINSRGRLYAKTVNRGTDVIVIARSVENKDAYGEYNVRIKPKQEKTFMAVMTADPEDMVLGSSLNLNIGVETSIFGQWYIREEDVFESEYDCTYFTSNSAVASIDANGTLKTKKAGSATITVRATDPDSGNVYTTKFTVKVSNLVGFVEINGSSKPKNDVLNSGNNVVLSATTWTDSGMSKKAANQGITWKVYQKNEDGDYVTAKAASVSSGGKVTANSVKENTTVYVVATSKANSTFYDYYALTIRPKYSYTLRVVYDDTVDGKPVERTGTWNVEIGTKGDKVTNVQAKAYIRDTGSDEGVNVTWSTSNSKIIGVKNKNELIFGGKTGKVKVTAKLVNGKNTYTASMYLNVVKSVNTVTVSKKYATQELYSGKTLLMVAKVESNDTNVAPTNKSVIWTTDASTSVATINSTTGLIRANKGLTKKVTINVTATAADGSDKSNTTQVTIYPLASKVTIKKGAEAVTAMDMAIGASETLTVEFTPVGEANSSAVKWSTSRSSVVSVDKTGKITAKRKGTATIKAAATDGSGKYKTVKVTVK